MTETARRASRAGASEPGGARRLDCAEALVAGLLAAGVHEMFGIAGGKFTPLMHAVSREPRMRFTGVRHESAAAFMATAVAHRTGGLAACVAEMGPGALNLAAGLDTAYANHLPVIALTVGPPGRLSDPGHGQLMELDTPAVFGALTRWRATLSQPERTGELLARAVREARAGGGGPVHLELDYDVLGTRESVPEAALEAVGGAAELGRAPADPRLVARAAELLRTAEHPLLIAGGGAVSAEAGEELRALAERLDAPALLTQMAIGLLDDGAPALVGQGGIVFGDGAVRAMREADVVLAVGCRFSSWLWDGNSPAGAETPGQALIHLDRDPSQIGRLRPAAVGLVGDARAVLAQLLAELGYGPPATAGGWRDELRAELLAYRTRLRALGAGEPGVMHPAQLARALGDALPQDALVVYDGAHTSFWSNDLTPVDAPRTRFHDPGAGHLGFGVPYAHALALIEPGRPVIDITGDGAIGFAIAELDTAVRLGLDVVHVVHDNQSWGVIAHGQSRQGFTHGTGLEGTDYAAIARGFGARGERIDSVEKVAPALERALAAGGVTVIDARVRFEPHPGLPRFAATARLAENPRR